MSRSSASITQAVVGCCVAMLPMASSLAGCPGLVVASATVTPVNAAQGGLSGSIFCISNANYDVDSSPPITAASFNRVFYSFGVGGGQIYTGNPWGNMTLVSSVCPPNTIPVGSLYPVAGTTPQGSLGGGN